MTQTEVETQHKKHSYDFGDVVYLAILLAVLYAFVYALDTAIPMIGLSE